MSIQSTDSIAAIPMRTVGPIKIIGPELLAELMVPLATFELPLWPSTDRGARACFVAGGITTIITQDGMTRSVVVEADGAMDILTVLQALTSREEEIKAITAKTSRFIALQAIQSEQVGNLLYIRLQFATGDAAGHNMTTLAAEHFLEWLLNTYPFLRYISISANYCTDKKVSAVNGILGRGKRVIAEVLLPRKVVARYLRSTPAKIVDLHVKKNLLGGILAGSVRSANAHFANLLLAFYLATGQDAANIVEGSQGIVHAECRGEDLYFSVTLPNVIVGCVGNGKELPFVQKNLAALDCLSDHARVPGVNARRLAAIVTATVLCGELSLLAAQTNPGELIQSHVRLERKTKQV